MKQGAENGYTVLEALLFVAISAAMLAMALGAFSGRQANVQFTQAVRDLDSRIQDTLNDVSTGFFNNTGNIQCTVNITGVVVTTGGSDAQGESNSCVFLGKAIQFMPDTGADDLNILTIVGRRTTAAGVDVTTLAEAQPVAVALTNAVESTNTQWGLTVTKVAVDGMPITTYGIVGFFSSFSRSVGGDDVSNSQAVRYAAIPSTTPQTIAEAAVSIGSADYTMIDLSLTKEVVICVESSNSSKIAAITLGGGSGTGTLLDFDQIKTAGVCA